VHTSMSPDPIGFSLCILGIILQLGVVLGMLKRGLQQNFPVFFSYVTMQACAGMLALALRSHPMAFFYVSWSSKAILAFLIFWVLPEVLKDAFRPYDALRDLAVILFRWSLLVCLLVAAMWGINSSHGGSRSVITDWLPLLEHSAYLAQCMLVFFFLLLTEYLGVDKRGFLYGVALGIGLYAVVSLILVAFAHQGSVVSTATLHRLENLPYVVSALVWLSYSASGAFERSTPSLGLGAQFQRWIVRAADGAGWLALVDRGLIQAYLAYPLRRAIAECRSAIRLDPQNAKAHLKLARLLRQEGEDAEARTVYERAAKISWDAALESQRVLPADSLLDTMDRVVERMLYADDLVHARAKASEGRR